eukprot:m.206464 g.206464  ORF g.206464 m.206464 type:complete len:110 (+) comp15425_c0_seq16:6678-7007(+)
MTHSPFCSTAPSFHLSPKKPSTTPVAVMFLMKSMYLHPTPNVGTSVTWSSSSTGQCAQLYANVCVESENENPVHPVVITQNNWLRGSRINGVRTLRLEVAVDFVEWEIE